MPQGAVVSPLIANVYLHYTFDLWADVWRRKVARWDVIIVRYAEDLVMGFRQRADAVRFLEALVTALFFSIGKTLIGLYLGKSSVGSAYGAAGPSSWSLFGFTTLPRFSFLALSSLTRTQNAGRQTLRPVQRVR